VGGYASKRTAMLNELRKKEKTNDKVDDKDKRANYFDFPRDFLKLH